MTVFNKKDSSEVAVEYVAHAGSSAVLILLKAEETAADKTRLSQRALSFILTP